MLIALMLAAAISGPIPPQATTPAKAEVRVHARGGPDGERPHDLGPRGPGGPSLDKNGDGVVTREEFLARQTQAFDFLDKNGDGQISTEEFAEGRAAAEVVLDGPGGRHGPGPGGGRMMPPPHGGPDVGPGGDLPPPPPAAN